MAGLLERMAKALTRHLEYLGYQVEAQPDGWSYATHPVRFNIHVRPFELGVRLHCIVWIGDAVASRRAWLQFVNRTNDATTVARFTFGRDEEGTYYVRMRGLLPARYDRRLFGLLLDAWHEDLAHMRSAPREEHVEDDENNEARKPAAVVN
jgi:hypothetical protein